MTHQIWGYVLKLAANANVRRLALLGLALVVAPLGIPGGGGGGVG